jgi:cardiolipin synthase
VEKLLDAVTTLACLLSPEKMLAVAARVRRTDVHKASALSEIVGTPIAAQSIEELINAWKVTHVSSAELASMMLGASHAIAKLEKRQSTELVWTGPTTPFVAARRTEQALLQVINLANNILFITSFVAYDVPAIIAALNAAITRGVEVSMLLELSHEHGGSISFDGLSKMKKLVPASRLFAWREKAEPFYGGSVHAKIAVADGKVCFITSANLTGHAMEKNMEAGVLISGGDIPKMLDDHMRSLVGMKVISPL